MTGIKKNQKISLDSHGVSEDQAEKIKQSMNSILEHNNVPEDKIISISLRDKRRLKIPDFVMIFQDVMDLLFFKEVDPSAFVVVYYFIRKLQWSNHIGIDQKTISEDTGLSLSSVGRAISKLKDLKVIIPYQDVQDKRRNVYILNPSFTWKGTEKRRREVLKQVGGQYSLFDVVYNKQLDKAKEQ